MYWCAYRACNTSTHSWHLTIDDWHILLYITTITIQRNLYIYIYIYTGIIVLWFDTIQTITNTNTANCNFEEWFHFQYQLPIRLATLYYCGVVFQEKRSFKNGYVVILVYRGQPSNNQHYNINDYHYRIISKNTSKLLLLLLLLLSVKKISYLILLCHSHWYYYHLPKDTK